MITGTPTGEWFQHTAARRRLGNVLSPASFKKRVSTHSRPKAAGFSIIFMPQIVFVSTHSRPKAAGIILSNHLTFLLMFQHTAARRRLEFRSKIRHQNQSFQHTAARRRLVLCFVIYSAITRCFNTQPPEGGWLNCETQTLIGNESFNTQPPEGGWQLHILYHQQYSVSTHSRPKAAGLYQNQSFHNDYVSTHSRPKAAGRQRRLYRKHTICFNTQPPEGGWVLPALKAV